MVVFMGCFVFFFFDLVERYLEEVIDKVVVIFVMFFVRVISLELFKVRVNFVNVLVNFIKVLFRLSIIEFIYLSCFLLISLINFCL